MKRLRIAIGLLVLILCFGVVSLTHLYRSQNQLIDQLDQMIRLTEQKKIDQAISLTDDFHTLWHQKEDIMVRYVRHADIESITSAVSALKPCLEQGQYGDFFVEANRIKEMILRIFESELPSILNVF